MLSGSWYIYTNGSAESTFATLFGKNHIGMMLPDRSLIRCFLTWISASMLTAVKAIIPDEMLDARLKKFAIKL